MSGPADFILVLCYANWCGYCKTFYLKDKNDKPLSLEEVKNLKDLSWQKVKAECGIKATQFEQKELDGEVKPDVDEKKKDGVDIKDIDLEQLKKDNLIQGWPTILILKKDNSGKYVYHETYKGGRAEIEQFTQFIKKSTKGDGEKSKDELKGGKRRSKKAGTKKSSRKGSRKLAQDGGKRRSKKAGTKKGSKKGSRKIQDGGKRRSKKAGTKKSSRKGSRKLVQDGGKRRSKKSVSKKGSKKGKKY
jgi:thiol-disulfide isomerase/thioredoxin